MLTDQEKLARKRLRMLDKAREYTTGTYIAKFVAPLFQKMIRAEYGAEPAGRTPAIVDGELTAVYRDLGYCVCVTCGQVHPWSSGLGGVHCGHFLASRRNSILFEEDNVDPQCSKCNRYRDGAPQEFRIWMLAVRGKETVERLERLKGTIVQFSREELVDKRLEYQARLKTAEERMRGTV